MLVGVRRAWLHGLVGFCTVLATLGLPVLSRPASAAADAFAPSGTVLVGWGELAPPQGAAIAYGSVPQSIPSPAGVAVAQLAAGRDFALALDADGAVYSWGANLNGQLGNGTTGGGTQADPAPVTLPGHATATAVSANSEGETAAALGADGTVYAWGANGDCQIGGQEHHGGSGAVANAVAVPLPDGVHATAVSVGTAQVLALGSDGTVYSWGYDGIGNPDTGNSQEHVCAAKQVRLPGQVLATSVVAGRFVSYAAGDDGSLYAWGADDDGNLGNGTPLTSSAVPVRVALPDEVHPTAVSASLATYALGSDGNLYSWGNNDYGGLGNGTTAKASTPVQITLPGGTPATAVSAGEGFALVTAADGNVYGWGRNSDGELGDGTTIERHAPVRSGELPGAGAVTDLAAGFSFSLAVAGSTAPQFTVASPPMTATGDSSLDYTFTAEGYPAPTYALAPGAPGWLSLNSDSGELTGRLPDDASTFTFAVTATNAGGSTTAGPFTVTVPVRPVNVSGTVTGAGGAPVSGAAVDVCLAGGSVCRSTSTDSSGAFTATAAAGSTVVVTAYPSPGSGLTRGSSGTLMVSADGLSGVTVALSVDLPPPAGEFLVTSGQVGTTAGGEPVFHWEQPAVIHVTGCPYGSGLLTLVGENAYSGDAYTGAFGYHAYPLVEAPAGSGTYTAVLPPQYPIHGPVDLESTVACAGADGVAPSVGLTSGGQSVAVSGAGFGGATQVRFGAHPATDLDVLSDGLLTVTAPAGTGTVPVTVTRSSGATLAVGDYTYESASTHPALRSAAIQGIPRVGSTSAPDAMRWARAVAMPRADTSTTDSIANITEWIYNHFPGGQAGTLRTAIATAVAALQPSCDSDRAALKASVHLAIQAALTPLVAVLTPPLTDGAEVLLAALVDPLIALVLEPAVALLVKSLVGFLLNKLADAVIDAAIDAALGACPHQTNALIDPSGTVTDTNGNPIAGATVTILRADTSAGPFVPVDVTEPGLEPAVNPETTAADAVFHWDVRAGSYEVKASAPDCTVPGHADQDTATIGPYPVPPPQVGLTITLVCPNEQPPPTPIVSSLTETTGPLAGGTDLIVSGTGFTPAVTVTVGGVAAASTTYLGPSALEIVTPAGRPGDADVVAHTAGGDSDTSASDAFFYGATPSVSGLDVANGPISGGTRVTITGSGFTGTSVVGFGGMPGTDLSVASDTEVHVTTPRVAAPGPVDVEVVTPAGANPLGAPAEFAFTALAPPTAPDPPTDVRAVAGQDGAATVSFTAPVSDGAAAISRYDITPSPACAVSCTGLETSSTSTSVGGLTDGVTYTFTVTAVNSVGPSAPSASSAAVTPTAAPTVPVSGATADASTPVTASSGGTTATASGGTGTVTVGQYVDDPTAPLPQGVAYTDVATSTGSTFTQVLVVDCGLHGGTSLSWWDPATNAWRPVTPAATYAAGPPACLTVTLNSTSSPTVSQLHGTIFGAVGVAAPPPTSPPPASPSPVMAYVATGPTRILDSRVGTGVVMGRVGPRQAVTVSVPNLPAGVTAVVLNLTGTGLVGAPGTFVSACPAAQPLGECTKTSALNVLPGVDVANEVIVPVGADGKVTLFNNAGSVDLVGDLVGYETGGYSATGPTRILDSRVGTGVVMGRVGPRQAVTVSVPNLPAGVTAVVLNLTGTGLVGAPGTFVSACPAAQPLGECTKTSALNVLPGVDVANEVIVPVGADGKVTLFNNAGSVDLVGDLVGYETGGYSATGPTRILDSRVGTGVVMGRVGPRQAVTVSVPNLPAGVTAVVLNLTGTGLVGAPGTFVSACPAAQPLGECTKTSALNVLPGVDVANEVIVPVGADGKVTLFNNAGSVNLVGDLVGYQTNS